MMPSRPPLMSSHTSSAGTGYTCAMTTPETDGVKFTHLDEPLFDGAGATKTSGSKGLHVYVPVDAASDDAAAVTRAIAARAERHDPDLATTAFIKEDRHGKVFLDSTRAYGASVVAAYSPRVRPGVPV